MKAFTIGIASSRFSDLLWILFSTIRSRKQWLLRSAIQFELIATMLCNGPSTILSLDNSHYSTVEFKHNHLCQCENDLYMKSFKFKCTSKLPYEHYPKERN